MIEIVLDFETCNPYCDVTDVGSTVYAQHWATEILCLCWQAHGIYEDPGSLWAPGDPHEREDALMALARDPQAIFVAHSAGFEKDIWREIMVPQYGFPDIPNERWHDTQAVCAMKAVPLSLEKVLPVLGLGEKDKVGSKLTIGLSKFSHPTRKNPVSALPDRTNIQRVYEYCGKDVDDEVALHRRLGCLPDVERRVWLLDQSINERGVALDRGFIAGAQRVINAARSPLIVEFAALTGLQPGQTAAVIKWAQDQGVDLPNLQKGTIAELLGEDDEGEGRLWLRSEGSGGGMVALPTNVRRALAIRALVGSSSISKLSRMASCIADDGRVHRLFQYHGTGPGRWAGRLFNPLNFPRGLVRTRSSVENEKPSPPHPEELAAAITTGSLEEVDALGLVVEELDHSWHAANPIEAVASALRHAIIPAPSKQLVVGDFVQIQARIVMALAGQHDFLDRLRQGFDPYCMTSEKIYNKPAGTWTKANCPTEVRQVGKNTFLGCGFQMGAAKFHEKYCPDQPSDFAQTAITAYRTKIAPRVPPLWYALEEAALRTVWDRRPHEAYGIRYEMEDGWLTARLLDGKKIYYWNPQKAACRPGWSKDCWTYQAMKQGQLHTISAYGGLLTENVVMGHERQLLVRAMFRCEKENLPVIFNGYDEIVCEADADWPALQQIMEDPPSWAAEIKLPIAAEGWVGSRYRKG